MKRARHNEEKGFLIYKLGEQYLCTLIETSPDSWEIVCKAGKKCIGNYTRAKKITDEFVALYIKCCGENSDPTFQEEVMNTRFQEFLDYRMVG